MIPKYLKADRLRLFFLAILVFQVGYSQETEDDLESSENKTASQIKEVLDSLVHRMNTDFYENNYAKIIENSDVAFKLARSIHDKNTEFKVSRYLGNALVQIQDTVRAKNIFNNSYGSAVLLNNEDAIGQALLDLGNLYYYKELDDKAVDHYEKAIPYFNMEKESDFRQLYVAHYNLAEIYLKKDNHGVARIHVDVLDKLYDKLSSPEVESSYYNIKGNLYIAKKQPDRAIYFLKKNISIAQENGFMDMAIDGYEMYVKALLLKKSYKELHFVKEELDKYRSEKYEKEKAAALEEITAKMDLDQYKQKLKAKNLENELNKQRIYRRQVVLYVTAATTLILIIFLISLYISFRNRKKLVTELKQSNGQFLEAKKKAEELAQVKTNFLSAISHELRTPLYGIIGISSILKEELKSKKHEEDIDSLKFSADYLLALVNDLLFLNRLESFKDEKLEHKPFEIRELVSNITNSFEFMRTKNNNEIEINIAASTPRYLKGDFVKLSQILMNLIGNACKFTEEGNIAVSVKTSPIDHKRISLHFSIADNGLGISEEKQKVIFNEFTQDANSNDFQGTGLGLSIVKKLLDLHKAPIVLESKKNVGTHFKFTIDYEIASSNDLEVVDKEEKVDKHIQGSHILIVDDNRINRLVTRKTLERNNYVCSTVVNGKEAVEAVKKEIFDLILMDVNMPVMNGFEATTLIRRFNKDIPIIALTAIDPTELGENIHSIGFNDSIIKPYKTVEFLKIIRRNFICTIKI